MRHELFERRHLWRPKTGDGSLVSQA
jgi:hypothetical protein